VEVAELVERYPRLWHMAHHGSWPAIRDRGLWCTKVLLDDYGIVGQARKALELERRPSSVHLTKDGLPPAVIRDQLPMTDAKLASCLNDGMIPRDWYQLLNSRTFFWLSRSRIWTLLRARAYRDLKQTVLTVDTAGVVAAHSKKVWLSPINSGATLFKAQQRGKDTFQRIEDFPFDQRSHTRPLSANVVELLVEGGVPDIAKYVLAVHTVKGDAVLEEIWRSPRAQKDDHP